MKTYVGKNTLNILKVKLLTVLGCCIRQSPKDSLLSLYHFYIHGNIALGITTTANLKKYTVNINMLSELYIVRLNCHILRELFKECTVLIVYQVNICKHLVFMHQINSNTVPTIFLNKFKKPTHNYPTNLD